MSPAPTQSAPPPLIQLDKLTKRYGNVQALRGADGTVTGKIIGLLGPNGAGKSTLLKCLLGLIPFEGDARVLGLSAAREGVKIRDRVGYMPEQETFLPGMSAVELCTYAAELSGLPRTEAIQRAHAALYYAGLEDKRYQPIDGYSTGMKQSVKLATALVHDPEILFLDEPTNGLDPRAREQMLKLITELPERRGCAVVLSTHLLPDVERVCDHAMIMHMGQLRFVGTIDELRSGAYVSASAGSAATAAAPTRVGPAELMIEVKAESQKLADALVAAGATCNVITPLALAVTLAPDMVSMDVFRHARAAGVQIRGIMVRRTSMEDAFLKVIGATGENPAAIATTEAPMPVPVP